MSSRFDDFRIVRLWRGLNRAAQLALALALVLGLNYLASQPEFFFRRDLTATRAHSLAPESVALLRNLGKTQDAKETKLPPVEVFVTLPRTVEGDNDEAKNQRRIIDTINAQLKGLLDAFVYETGREGRDPVRVERVDLTRNAKLYTDIAEKLKGTFQPGRTSLVVRCGERMKAVDASELFRVRKDRKGQPELDGFRGEEALLSAILEVTDFRKPVVYYTMNHGELIPEATNPLRCDSRLVAELKSRRFEVQPLNLEQAKEVPANAELLIIAGPLADFTPRESDKLRRYLRERNGRMLALIEPTAPTGLDDLFLDWGLLAQDALVIDTDPKGKSPDGDLVISRLPQEGLHPVTQILVDMQLPLYAGRFRPVQGDPGMPLDGTLAVTNLFYTSDSAWGERDYRRPPYRPDIAKGDIPPPLCLGVAAERAVRVKGEARIPAGRLIVIGTGDIAADARFDKGGNRHFLINAANWLLGRTYLVNVPARPLTEFKVEATAGDLTRLARRYAMIPGAVVLLGLLVHFWRRRV